MTNQTIPPCPVCGKVPPFDKVEHKLLWASCNCITAPDLYEPWEWEHACMRELGWKCAELGITTIAQLNARLAPDPRVAVLDVIGLTSDDLPLLVDALDVAVTEIGNVMPAQIELLKRIQRKSLIASQRGEVVK